jgi:hypothetical protein
MGDERALRYQSTRLVFARAQLAYFVLIFSSVAIVLAASDVLDGRDATVGAAIGGATRRLGPMAAWEIRGWPDLTVG